MHRIQVNSVPVSPSEGNKSSRPEQKVKGEKFDAVMEKAKGKTGADALSPGNPDRSPKKKLTTKKAAERADSGLRVKEKKTPITKKASDKTEKGALNRSAGSLNQLKGRIPDHDRTEKIPKDAGITSPGKVKDIKKSESPREAGTHKKNDLKEKPVDSQSTVLFSEPAVQKVTSPKEHKLSAKRAEAVGEKKEETGKKDLKQAARSKILDLRTPSEKQSSAIKNNFTGDNPSSGDSGKSTPEQSSAPQVVTLTAKGDVSFQSQFLGEMEPKTVLLNELHDTLNDKIVKQSNIILKDGDAGEIRLILKPESLGKVRIRLHMDENNLSGKIFVDSAAVKEVFEQNMFRLERAFSENGFSMGSLDVSVGDKGSGKSKENNTLVSEKTIKIIEDSIPRIDEDVYSSNVIDLVV